MVFYLLSLQVFNICDFRAWFPWERNHQTSTSNHPIGHFFTAPREIPKSPVASPSAKRGTPPLHIHNLGIRRANWARREEARSRTAANGSDNRSLDCFRKIERSGKQSSMSRKQTISAIELTGYIRVCNIKAPLEAAQKQVDETITWSPKSMMFRQSQQSARSGIHCKPWKKCI